MDTTGIEWQAADLVSLGEEFRAKVDRVTDQFKSRLSGVRDKTKADTLRGRLKQLVGNIQESYEAQIKILSKATDGASLYNHALAGVDMDAIVYRGDRDCLGQLLADPEFSATVNRLLAEHQPYNARKELLSKGLKVNPAMMPKVYQVVEHCKTALDLKTPIELYVYQDAAFNAGCFPPVKDRILLMVTSALLERFSQRELAFVIGHELGHYLFEHTRFPVDYILKNGQGYLSPVHAMRLFSWIRNAEVTADRVGLLCCRDFKTATNTFFKLSSGISVATVEFNLDAYLEQLADLQEEIEGQKQNPQDWFTTHPFNPLRIKALEIFNRSQTYQTLIGQPGGDLSREALEDDVAQLMSIMDPTYLKESGDAGQKAQRFVLTAGYLVAAANGVVERSELQALSNVLGGQLSGDEISKVAKTPVVDIRDEVRGLAKDLLHLLSPMQRLQLIRDMVIISYADGSVDRMEMECLIWLASHLQVESGFIQQVLSAAQRGVD